MAHDELVKRLRDFDYGADIYMVWPEDPDCVSEAADLIEAQAAALQAKEDGLKVRDNHIAKLEAALSEVYETWAGSEGFIPETAPEGYLQWLAASMAKIAGKALEQEQ